MANKWNWSLRSVTARTLRVVSQALTSSSYRQPRWSPDDSTIAYLHNEEIWADDIFLVPASGGPPRALTHENTLMSGMAWTPDGSHLIYSSARGSTLLYLPTLHLWEISKSGGEPRQLTFGEAGDESPDIDNEGRILVSRKHMDFDIWKFPVDGTPTENVGRGVRITKQTGQVQTPTLDSRDNEMAYLSDSGGHGNVWVLPLGGGQRRQITFEKDPVQVIGVPIWSPDGKLITFATGRVSREAFRVGYYLVHPDGSDLHMIIPAGTWTAWSGDSKWLYYSESSPVQETGGYRLMKIPVDGGPAVLVRSDNARGPAPAPDGCGGVLRGAAAKPEWFAGLRAPGGAAGQWSFNLADPHLWPANTTVAGAATRDLERREVAGAASGR